MNEKLPCKCKHVRFDHREYYSYPTACWNKARDTYGIPACECLKFREMTNLEYLEYKYEICPK